MKKSKCAKLKTVIIVSLFVSGFTNLYSGQDCRSMLGAYITPIFGSENFSAGMEASVAFAGMTDRNVKNGLLIGGLNFTFDDNKQQFYVEGAYKNFFNSAGGPGRQNVDSSVAGYEGFAKVDKQHWGFREAFYKFSTEDINLSVGLQTLKLTDYFMLDERVVGINSNYNSGNFTYSISAASVLAQFARYADFCGTRHIYNLTNGGRVDFLGDDFGKSNFISGIVKWTNKPEQTQKSEANKVNDDEFETFSPISSNPESKPFVQELGAMIYEEFGDAFPDYRYFGGVFAKFNLPLDLELKSQIMYQHIYKEKAIAYYLEMSRFFDWGDGDNTLVSAAILAKAEIDDNTMFYPSYTNLFMGEVMKMDALDLPVAQCYLKHNFSFLNGLYLKIHYANQLEASHTNELDIEASVKLFNHIKLTGISGLITSQKLKQDTYFGRLEIRVAI